MLSGSIDPANTIALIEPRSRGADAWAGNSIAAMVGTRLKIVTRSFSIRRSTSFGSKFTSTFGMP